MLVVVSVVIRFTNTLSGRKEGFYPLEPGLVKMYSCGPTVYDYPHIGNYRAFLFADLLKRYLRFRGYRVVHVMNITDVDDKTIKKAQELGVPLEEVSRKYEKVFMEDLEALNVDKADFYPRATEHIEDMVQLILRLKEKGYAYQSDGSTYYRVNKFPGYGKLSKVRVDKVLVGGSGRVDADEYGKEDVRDFVLWKARKPGEPFWDTVLGPGRPGWHIECSAMSMKYLGETFDIHTGGEDNIFPHHENEIAQSEGATGKTFVRYWLHVKHLVVEGEKMSKSLGNYYTLRDLLREGYDPMAIRYTLINAHYRSELNFTFESLAGAEKTLEHLNGFLVRVKESGDGEQDKNLLRLVRSTRTRFVEEMDNDLGVPKAMAAVFRMVREVNKALEGRGLDETTRDGVLSLMLDVSQVLGINLSADDYQLDERVKRLIREREEARKRRDYEKADMIRQQLLSEGIILEDTPSGVRWRRKVKR